MIRRARKGFERVSDSERVMSRTANTEHGVADGRRGEPAKPEMRRRDAKVPASAADWRSAD